MKKRLFVSLCLLLGFFAGIQAQTAATNQLLNFKECRRYDFRMENFRIVGCYFRTNHTDQLGGRRR